MHAFREAVRLDPRLTEAWYGLGLAQLGMRELSEALEALQKVVRLDRSHAGAWVALASAFGERGQFDKAAQAFEQAVRLRPRDAAAWYALGSVRVQAGVTEPAVSAFRRAVEIDPDLAEAWHSLGVALAFPGPEGRVLPEDALAAFRQAVRLRPDLAEAWHGLGATLSGLGRHEEAIGRCSGPFACGPTRPSPGTASAWPRATPRTRAPPARCTRPTRGSRVSIPPRPRGCASCSPTRCGSRSRFPGGSTADPQAARASLEAPSRPVLLGFLSGL